MNRKDKYKVVSEAINQLNNEEINNLLLEGKPIHQGICGTGVKLDIESVSVFAKRIPITEIEFKNQFSTKNLFDLPTYYQYGVGSTGFSVWRELKTHQKTTEWVLNGECKNFPLMYGYAIIDEENPQKMTADDLKKYVDYWGESVSIGSRMESLLDAKQSLVVFLEYIPYTFNAYRAKLDPKIIEKDMFDTVEFMMSKEMIHFDTHGRNILTDGERLYFADFGLATSLDFELSIEEIEFFNKNIGYDRALSADAICHNPEKISDISSEMQSLIDKYKTIADRYHQFIADLRCDQTKELQFPGDEIDQLFNVL